MKKAKVLQDIKNTNSLDPDPPVTGRRRKERSRKPQDLDVSQTSSPAHKLNLPLLQRIQMALTKTKEDRVLTEVEKQQQQSADDQLPDGPALVQPTAEEPIHDNQEKSISEGKDDILSSQSLNAGVEVDDSIAGTANILEQTTANSSLDQAFCNISVLEQSAVDSQSRVSAGTSLLCSEQAPDLDTTSIPEEALASSHSPQEDHDKLSHITNSTLMSPDMLKLAGGFKADAERVAVQTKKTEQKVTPHVCVLTQLEENQNIFCPSSMDDVIGGPSGTKRDSSATTVSAISIAEEKPVPNPDVSTPKDLLDDLDFEVEDFVSGRESKRRKSSRRRSQQVLSIPVLTAEPSPEVVDKSSQEEETRATQDTTPSLCIINDKKRGARGRHKRTASVTAIAASPVENWPTVSPEDFPLSDQLAGNVTPDTDVSDHSLHSDRSPATTPIPDEESLPTSPEETDHAQIDPVVSDIITPSICMIDDRNSRRRRKKSPVTATLPEDGCIPEPSENVSEQTEVHNEMVPAVCISSGRGSRGRRRKAPTDTSPSSDISASGSPEDNGQWEQKTDDASSVCLINDAPRGSHKKRRKRAGKDTPSPEFPVQSSASEVCTPVSVCTSETTDPAESTTQGVPELYVVTPWATPQTTPLRGEPQFSFTAVKEVEDRGDNSVNLKRKVSKKRRRQADLETPVLTEASSPVLPPENIQQGELPVLEEDKQTIITQNEAEASQEKQDELMLDDIDFGESFPRIEKPKKQQKRRRRSADFDISTTSVVESPNLEENLEGLNWLENQAPSRRSKRLRRKSLDLYRESISKAREEDEEKRRQSVQQEISMAEENQEVSEDEKSQEVVPEDQQEKPKENLEKVDPMDIASASTVPVISPEFSSDSQTDDSVSEEEPRRSRRAPKVNLTAQLEEAVAISYTAPKPKRGKNSKKNEPSVEDIYLNKLWRTQMPKDKIWETIFEAPKSTKWGTDEYMSKMRLKRQVNFDDFYATNRLKRRRQKALKLGWKPLSEQKDMVAAANLEERMQSLDREISIIDTKTLCTPEVGDNVLPTVCVRLVSSTEEINAEGEDDFYTPVQSASNLLQFGQLEDVDTDLSVSLNSADVSASPLQSFATPMLESVGDKLKSFTTSASKTQSDSQL